MFWEDFYILPSEVLKDIPLDSPDVCYIGYGCLVEGSLPEQGVRRCAFLEGDSSGREHVAILVRNTLAWPQIKKQTVFPDDSNSVCFTCKAFYTSAARMVLIPSAQLTLDDMPVPDADITKVLKAPAVKINVVKYASLVRGDTACSLKGYPEQVAETSQEDDLSAMLRRIE